MLNLPTLFTFSFLLTIILGLEAVSISIPRRTLESIVINKQEYRITPIAQADQGALSTTYDIDSGFQGHPAILKLIEKDTGLPTGKPDHMQKEVRYATEVGQKLYFSATDHPNFYVFVLRNVRHTFPKEDSPERKFVHEWYLLDQTLSAQDVMKTMRGNMLKRAMKYVKENGLMHSDLHLHNVLVDKSFKDLEFIDWAAGFLDESDFDDSDGPDEFAGVGEVSKDEAVAAQEIAAFEKLVKEIVWRNFNLIMLQDLLERHNKSLRKKDMPAFEAEKARLEEEE